MRTSTRFGGTGIDSSGATARQILQSVGGGVFALTDSPEFLATSIVDASGNAGIDLGTTANGGLITVYDISNGNSAVVVDGEGHAVFVHSNTALTITLDGALGQVIAISALLQNVIVQSLTGTTVPYLQLRDPDLSHSFTSLPGTLSIVTADTAGVWQETNTNNGGMAFAGFRDTDGAAVTFQGHIDSTAPTAAPVSVQAYKSDGAGSRAAVSGAELIADFRAGATIVYTISANGTFAVASGALTFSSGSSGALRIDANATGGNTRMECWDISAGSWKRVSIGVADSGGVGFKVLRIPN